MEAASHVPKKNPVAGEPKQETAMELAFKKAAGHKNKE